MSEDNATQGREAYATGDIATRNWFKQQWAMWPRRADERFTTNVSFHWGGVQQYRAENDRDPIMSKSFAGCVRDMDRMSGEPA